MNPDHNRLLLTHGNIQVSPQKVVQLNNSPNIAFVDESSEAAPSNAGYKIILTGYSEHIREKERKTNEYRHLLNSLKKLRALPRPSDGYKLKNSVSTFNVSDDYYRIDYRINSGQVVVFNIEAVDRLQKVRDRLEKAAVYKVKKNASGNWEVGQKVEDVTTAHAAVNGQSNNLAKATWLMGSHLEYEYGKQLTEYTLFHNPSVGGLGDTWESVQDKMGFTTDVTKKFASLLEKTQNRDTDTSWVVHSQGGLIFSEGVRYLLNGHSSWALNKLRLNGINSPQKDKLLDKQKVAFHGNANNNFRSKSLFERAGIDVVAIRAHDYDFVTNMVGLNTVNPRKLLGSAVYANHVFGGSIAQSPHTTIQSHESWEKNMQSGPGKGRGSFQKVFNSSGNAINKVAETIKNYLP
ncbi:MAG: hypothetical protein K6L76_11325 [Agarilytica sp.]